MDNSGVTLQDVADRAGLSLATASRVLNGSSRTVGAAAAEKIRRAAADLGYVSNGPAQALARSTTSVVGLVVHEVDDPYFAAIARGAMTVAARHGLLTTLANTFHDPDREIEYVKRLQAQRVRGLLLAGSGVTTEGYTEALAAVLAGFARGGGRIALVSDHNLPYPGVLPANKNGGAQVARHLHDLGHRKVGIISGPSFLSSVSDRLSGFTGAWESFGLDASQIPVVGGDFTRSGGFAATLALFERDPGITAIFALNDLMAAGALAALADPLGYRVPAEVSVVGFDDLWIAADLRTPLTTVRLPLEDMGAQAMDLLLSTESMGADKPRNIHVPVDLVVRSSTAPARIAGPLA